MVVLMVVLCADMILQALEEKLDVLNITICRQQAENEVSGG